jgi:hypothetical protein
MLEHRRADGGVQGIINATRRDVSAAMRATIGPGRAGGLGRVPIIARCDQEEQS